MSAVGGSVASSEHRTSTLAEANSERGAKVREATRTEAQLERRRAKDLAFWVRGRQLAPPWKPDAPGNTPPREGRLPDFVFVDTDETILVVEVTRLMPRSLRQLEAEVKTQVCARLAGVLPGTFIIHIEVSPTARHAVDHAFAAKAASAVDEIIRRCRAGSPRDTTQLASGWILQKLDSQGSSCGPSIIAPELPANLAAEDPLARELQAEFTKLLNEAEQKFEGYWGSKLLLVGIGQSGLDWEMHALEWRDGPGLIRRWILESESGLKSTDEIYLDPGVRVWIADPGSGVWQADKLHRVLAGHRYVDHHPGHFVCVWRRRPRRM